MSVITSKEVYDLVSQKYQQALKEMLQRYELSEAILHLMIRFPEVSLEGWMSIYDCVCEKA